MTSPLHKPPYGLLGAFNLKVTGDNPNKFGDTVLPTVDVYDQYLAGELVNQTTALTITNPATLGTVDITCPLTENWRVLGVSLTGPILVADTALREFAFISYGNLSGIAAHRLWVGEMVGSAVASILQRDVALLFAQPLYTPAGGSFRFSIQMSATPAVASSYTASVLYQKITL